MEKRRERESIRSGSKKEATQDGKKRKKEERIEKPFSTGKTRKTARSSFADKSRDLFRGLRKLIRRSDSSVPQLDSNLQQAFHGFRRSSRPFRLLGLVTDISFSYSFSLVTGLERIFVAEGTLDRQIDFDKLHEKLISDEYI